jgi:hypothetical protein
VGAGGGGRGAGPGLSGLPARPAGLGRRDGPVRRLREHAPIRHAW